MEMQQIHSTEEEKLRQKAEEQLKKHQSKVSLQSSEVDIRKLTHELKVHQIELELQNEELLLTKEQTDRVAEKYIELYDLAPAGYFTLSKEGKILRLNLKGANLLGMERQLLINRRLAVFMDDNTKTVFNGFLNKVFKERSEESCEVTLTIEGRPTLYVYITGHIADNDEKCQLTMADITQIKNNEIALIEYDIKLRQLNADKDRFVSILGHDLKNPFGNILGLSEILFGEINSLKTEEIEEIASHIFESAKIINKLLEDMLMWARVQRGNISYQPLKLALADILRNIVEVLKPSTYLKGITISLTNADQINVYADTDMLKTILLNLISNAIKFTNIDGTINISAEKTDSDITISVSDNGIGIGQKDLSKLFDISAVQTTKGTAGETGTGLGLLLCKEFVEKHGGKIWVESEIGKGSDFKFTLPEFSGKTDAINN